MFKRMFALCLSLVILACITPVTSLAATTETVYLELDAFEKATQAQLDKMIKSPAISASVNTDTAFIPQGATSSIKVHYDHTKLEGWGQFLGFETETVLLDPAPQSLEGYEGLRFWVNISGNEWGNGFDTLQFMVGDWSWGYRTYFYKNIAIDPKGYTGYIDVKFSELTDFYYNASNDPQNAGPSTVPPANIDYMGFKLTKNGGCYLTVDMYVSDVKAYKTVTLADKTSLNDAIASADLLKEDDFRPRTWEPFATALQNAKTVANDRYIAQKDVDDALAALAAAKEGLGLKADRTALSGKVTEAEALKKDDYLASSWTAFQTALNNAKTVVDDTNAEDSAVDAAMDALEEAMESLQAKPDKAALKTAISQAEALDKDDYEDASWADFAKALAAAKSLVDNAEATQTQVDKAIADLAAAKAALKEKAVTPSPETGSAQTGLGIALFLVMAGAATIMINKKLIKAK